MDKSTLVPGDVLYHKFLGKVKFTEACKAMEARNPDATSLFVEHGGDLKEVSRNLCSKVEV